MIRQDTSKIYSVGKKLVRFNSFHTYTPLFQAFLTCPPKQIREVSILTFHSKIIAWIASEFDFSENLKSQSTLI